MLVHLNVVAYRRGVRPPPARHGFVDDCHGCRAREIARAKEPAGSQWNLKRFEKIVGYRSVFIVVVWKRGHLDRMKHQIEPFVQRQSIHSCCRLYSGYCLQTPKDLIQQLLRRWSGVIVLAGKGYPGHNQSIGIKAQWHGIEVQQASHQKQGSREEHYSQCHLSTDQKANHSYGLGTRSSGTGSVGQKLDNVDV